MMSYNVLLLETIAQPSFDLLSQNSRVHLAEAPDRGVDLAVKFEIHAIVTRGKGDVSQQLIDQCPKCKVIARCGVGLDNINVPYASVKGIPVVNAPGINSDTVVEHTMALMLMLQRHLWTSISSVKEGNWQSRKDYAGDEIRGKTLGILGLGNIGRRVAKIAEAFGMNIIYWDKFINAADYTKLELEQLLQQSDIITIHLPLFESTRSLIGDNEIDKLKPGAILINTARGEILDEPAVVRGLQSGKIGGFGSDVLAIEPPEPDHPLLSMSNVCITPHAASLTALTYEEMCTITVKNVLAILENQEIDQRYFYNYKDLY